MVDDDDLVISKGGEFKNYQCKLTTKSIFELDAPVEDARGYIWERAAIIAHMRRHGNQHPAVDGAFITEKELKPARRLMRAAEQKRRQKAQGADEGVEVL